MVERALGSANQNVEHAQQPGCKADREHAEIEDEAKMAGKITLKVDQVRAIGNDAALAAGPYQITYTAKPAGSQFEGNWLRVFERQAGDWKIIASTFTPATTPTATTATGTTGVQPSTGTSTPPATGKALK